MLIYLDQNIVGYLSEGRLSLNAPSDVQWVYSNEHFTEIARGGKTHLLAVFETLRARQLEMVLDGKFKIADRAYLHDYSSPFERYQRHLEAIRDAPYNQSSSLELTARLYGGDNVEKVRSVPDRMDEQLRSLLEGVGPMGESLAERWKVAKGDLTQMIEKHLSSARTLESMRRPLGTSKGRGSNLETSEAPILALWNLLSPSLPGVNIDQFFGFDPLDKMGYQSWPLYLGIVGCHAVLNFLGYRPDKGLSAASTLPSVFSDGSHIAHAAFCRAVVSEDRRFCAKARAIYRYKRIPTEVVEVSIGNLS